GIIIEGAGVHSVTIQMINQTKFAFNLFTPGTRYEFFSVGQMTIMAKYGITNRWDIGTDYENNANPSRSLRITDVRFIGTYNTNDPNAQSTVVPGRAELETLGVGLHLV